MRKILLVSFFSLSVLNLFGEYTMDNLLKDLKELNVSNIENSLNGLNNDDFKKLISTEVSQGKGFVFHFIANLTLDAEGLEYDSESNCWKKNKEKNIENLEKILKITEWFLRKATLSGCRCVLIQCMDSDGSFSFQFLPLVDELKKIKVSKQFKKIANLLSPDLLNLFPCARAKITERLNKLRKNKSCNF